MIDALSASQSSCLHARRQDGSPTSG